MTNYDCQYEHDCVLDNEEEMLKKLNKMLQKLTIYEYEKIITKLYEKKYKIKMEAGNKNHEKKYFEMSKNLFEMQHKLRKLFQEEK